jgi:ornithine cyclodeaminase/alanine dehydrogenase-like protein (mu-crystallin family)
MHDLLIVSQADVPRLLPMRDCIEVMHRTLVALSEGKAILPIRTVIALPEQSGAFASMPAVLQAPPALGVKAITIYPGNEGTQFDSHQGAVLLFEPVHGSLVAIMDASAITAIRTAAVSAVATRALARPDATTLALIGSGVQAATHLEAMLAVRSIARVRVHSRTGRHADEFARRESARHGIPVEAAASAEEAVRDADIVCTVTSSRTPVVHGDWLSPGCHLNAVGASVRSARELDGGAVARSRLYVDRRESAQSEAGEFVLARDEGAIGEDHIVGEIGDVLIGRAPGRTGADDITLFKSVGLAVEDVAAAHHIHERSRERPDARRIVLGGERVT